MLHTAILKRKTRRSQEPSSSQLLYTTNEHSTPERFWPTTEATPACGQTNFLFNYKNFKLQLKYIDGFIVN